ncbi:MAG: Ig-like domain-containing protein, partial [Actinomycetota bacterium]|nr:Ig-like domain-containing protein [Actinomycetota bacterium]
VTTVASSPNAGVGVDGVLLFAKVGPDAATGTVAFADEGTPIAGCDARPVNAASASFGYATCVTSFATAGDHTVSVSYSGDGTYAPSSASTAVAVTPIPDIHQIHWGIFIEFVHNLHLFGL